MFTNKQEKGAQHEPMRLPTFIGGIHPPDNKALTADKEIEVYVPRGDLVFPMSQHIGVPCTPIVKKGDRVLVGQKIADSDAFVSAPILSSVSGYGQGSGRSDDHSRDPRALYRARKRR